MSAPLLTKEQLAAFKDHNYGHTSSEMQLWLKETFGVELTIPQIQRIRSFNKITCGISTKFGDKPAWNKGLHTASEKFLSHSFYKGHSMGNHLPLLTERYWPSDGWIYIKVAEPNVWKLKHHYVWEQVNGPVPEGKVILFLDGDKKNCDLNNLRLVDKKVQSTFAIRHLKSEDKELNKAGILVTELEFKLKDRSTE